MERKWALLFDLDQTLILTEEIQSLRDRGQWSRISAHFHLTRLPLDTQSFLQQVRPHFQLGIVTSSPRRYAEGLVAYYGLNIPILAAYHDTRKHKPDPAPLLLAAHKLHIPPAQCFHVGDQEKDVIAAHRAGMIPIGLSWANPVLFPSIGKHLYTSCTTWQDVFECIGQIMKKGE